MALNEMIAQGAQFKMPDPLEQYGRIAQIQQAQNQNALAQYQLGSAQRGDVQQNALYARLQDPTFSLDNSADLASLARFGTPGITAMKSITEAQNAALTGSKTRNDILKQQRDNFSADLLDLSGNPTDEKIKFLAKNIAADANYPDIFKKTAVNKFAELLATPFADRSKLLAMSGATVAERTTATQNQFTNTKPNFIERTDGSSKWMEDTNPNSATYRQIQSSNEMQLTPSDRSSAQTAANRLDFDRAEALFKKNNPNFKLQAIEKSDGTTEYFAIDEITKKATRITLDGTPLTGVNLPSQNAAIRQKFDQDKLDFERKNPGFTIEQATQADGTIKFKKIDKLSGVSTDVMDASGTPLAGAAKIALSPLATLQKELAAMPPNSKQADEHRKKILKDLTDTSQAQLKLAQDRFAWDKANPGYYTQALNNEDGSQRFVAVNRLTLKVYPLTEAAISSGTPPNIGAPLVGPAAGVVPTAVPAQTPGGPAMAGQPVPLTSAKRPSAFAEKAAAQKVQMGKDLTQAITELTDATKDGGLIDQSTGSGAGRLYDVGAGFFGQAPQGAIAIGKLQPIADIALKMVPRFEGPQSDKDTTSYKQAAGQLADPTLPTKIRKEAGKTVLRLMKARKEQFGTVDMVAEGTSTPAAAPDPLGIRN